MIKHIILIIGMLILLSVNAACQIANGYDRKAEYENQSVFVLVGYVWGPHFSDFIDWTNNHYAREFDSTDRIKDFQGGIDISAGLRKRFSRYFGMEFKVGYHTSSIKKRFDGYDEAIPFSQTQNLNLDVMKIAVSPMILFDFYDKQPFVPFVSAGVTFFSMRLDHAIDYYVRHTKVALASNFSIGVETPLTRKIKGDIRGDWTIGDAQMPVTQIYGQPESFKMSLNTSQIHFGVVFGLE